MNVSILAFGLNDNEVICISAENRQCSLRRIHIVNYLIIELIGLSLFKRLIEARLEVIVTIFGVSILFYLWKCLLTVSVKLIVLQRIKNNTHAVPSPYVDSIVEFFSKAHVFDNRTADLLLILFHTFSTAVRCFLSSDRIEEGHSRQRYNVITGRHEKFLR